MYIFQLLARGITALASTARWGAFTAVLSRYAGRALVSAKDVITWMGNNKGATALIATSLGEVGVSIADFFKDEPKTPELEAAARELSDFRRNPELTKKLVGILSADGDSLKVDSQAEGALASQLARVTLAYMRQNLLYPSASVDEVLELHAALQLFSAMSRETVAEMLRDRITPIVCYDASAMRGVLLAGV